MTITYLSPALDLSIGNEHNIAHEELAYHKMRARYLSMGLNVFK